MFSLAVQWGWKAGVIQGSSEDRRLLDEHFNKSMDKMTWHFKVWHLGDLGGISIKDFKDWLLQQISIRVWTTSHSSFSFDGFYMSQSQSQSNPFGEIYSILSYPHTYTYRHMYSCPFSISFITALLKGQLRTSGPFPELVRRLRLGTWDLL